MSKKIKFLAGALVLCSSLLTIQPANAATKNTNTNPQNIESQSKNNYEEEIIPEEKPNSEIGTKFGEVVPVKGDDVCLRKKPGKHSIILRQLNESDGDEVVYFDYRRIRKDGYDWAHVSYFSKEGRIDGYIATKFLY